MIKIKKENYLAVVLCVLLVLALVYILADKYNEGQEGRKNAVYQQGFDAGVQRANQLVINQIMSDLNTQGATAVTIPVSADQSVTIPLIMKSTFINTIVEQLNAEGKFSFQTMNQNNETVIIDLIPPSMCSQLG